MGKAASELAGTKSFAVLRLENLCEARGVPRVGNLGKKKKKKKRQTTFNIKIKVQTKERGRYT